MICLHLVMLLISVVAEGRSVIGNFEVTSLPEGDLHIQQCSENDGPDCAVRNAQFKSFLVCAPNDDDISSYRYQITVPTDDEGSTAQLSNDAGAAPEFNADAEEYGATATTLTTSDARCREILIRFWSIPSGSESATVNFVVRKVAFPVVRELYHTSFLVSNAPDGNEATTAPTGLTSAASLLFQVNGSGESGPSEAWQCSCLPS